MQQESQRSKSWIKASVITLIIWNPREKYTKFKIGGPLKLKGPNPLPPHSRENIIWPKIVTPALIQECKNDTPSLLVLLQQIVDFKELSMGPNTQYENAGVMIMAGYWVDVLRAFLNPRDVHRVTKACKM